MDWNSKFIVKLLPSYYSPIEINLSKWYSTVIESTFEWGFIEFAGDKYWVSIYYSYYLSYVSLKWLGGLVKWGDRSCFPLCSEGKQITWGQIISRKLS